MHSLEASNLMRQSDGPRVPHARPGPRVRLSFSPILVVFLGTSFGLGQRPTIDPRLPWLELTNTASFGALVLYGLTVATLRNRRRNGGLLGWTFQYFVSYPKLLNPLEIGSAMKELRWGLLLSIAYVVVTLVVGIASFWVAGGG